MSETDNSNRLLVPWAAEILLTASAGHDITNEAMEWLTRYSDVFYPEPETDESDVENNQ